MTSPAIRTPRLIRPSFKNDAARAEPQFIYGARSEHTGKMQEMKYMRLEGNYIIAFRDSAECLPTFTAVRLDRSARRLRRGSDASPTMGRRRLSPPGEATLVITGVPAHVDVDAVKGRLDDCIPGVVRVYREKESSNLPKPPVFVQTNRSIAEDAFMLRSDWVRAVDQLVSQSSSRVPRIIVDVAEDEPIVLMKAPKVPKINQKDLCPHGNYLAAGSCIQCMVNNQGRRSTFISDAALFRKDRKGSSGSVILPEPEQERLIGGLYELKQRRRSSYEIPVRLEDMFKSR